MTRRALYIILLASLRSYLDKAVPLFDIFRGFISVEPLVFYDGYLSMCFADVIDRVWSIHVGKFF